MKNNKGITLNSLIVYVIAMMIVIVLVGKITSDLYKRTKGIEMITRDISSLNILNTYFLKEVKTAGNKINHIENSAGNQINKESKITFTSGDVFLAKDHKIFYNTSQICNYVEATFDYIEGKTDEIKVIIKFDYLEEKELFYKIEEIY